MFTMGTSIPMPRNLEESFNKVAVPYHAMGLFDVKLELDTNQNFGINVMNDNFTGRLLFNGCANEEKVLSFLNNELIPLPVAIFGKMLVMGNVDLKISSLVEILGSEMLSIPEPWRGMSKIEDLKNVMVPLASEAYAKRAQNGEIIEDIYNRINEIVSGIDEINFYVKDMAFKLKFEGWDIFKGFLPDFAVIKGDVVDK